MTQRTRADSATKNCTRSDCDRPLRARGLCSTHYKAGRGYSTRYTITCVTCGAEHRSARRDGKFCSDECKGKSYRRQYSRALVPVEGGACLLPDQHPVRRLTNRPAPTRDRPYLKTIVAGPCAWCSTPFCALVSSGVARYCSNPCMKRALKAASRLRHGQFSIHPTARLAIYVRDAWTCQLCHEAVDPRLLGTSDQWAPSLDHIECQSWTLVPNHSPSNLRLAHRWCNAVRGDERYNTDFFTSQIA